MDNRLQVLIDYYEEERCMMVQYIDECVQEKDYLKAHQLSYALNRINEKLEIFNNLTNSGNDKKTTVENKIAALEEEIATGLTGMKSFVRNDLLVSKKEYLQQLNKAHQETHTNHLAFDQTLEKLISKKIKSFTLILNKQKDFNLKFKIIKKEFRVTIPNVDKLLKAFDYFGFQIKKYKLLGFQSMNGNRMILTLPCKTEDDTNQLKIII